MFCLTITEERIKSFLSEGKDIADISDQYDEDKIETIYISGDGASWIRQRLKWIDKSGNAGDYAMLN
ncbi:MAG TPA: hypothetical protein DDY59_16055 [Lachnospiraceae bacterium]|nr:hypothetical protein [Lachnospiraceae bacterium]